MGSSHFVPTIETDIGTLCLWISGIGHETIVFNNICFAKFIIMVFMNGFIVISRDVTKGSVESGYHNKHNGVFVSLVFNLIRSILY